jgi:hypothetical protein
MTRCLSITYQLSLLLVVASVLIVCQRCHLVGLRVVALALNGSVAPTHELKMKTSCFSAEIFGNSGFIDLLRRFCPPEVRVGCSSSMTDANVPTLLPEHASRGAFLLGEQSSFDDLWVFQKYCVPLVDSDSRSKGERGRDDKAIAWPVVVVELVIATLCVPWAVVAWYRQCSCALFRFFMSVWRLAACSVMLASCVPSCAVSVRGAPSDLKRQCSCSISTSSKSGWRLPACFVVPDVYLACCMVYCDASPIGAFAAQGRECSCALVYSCVSFAPHSLFWCASLLCGAW